MESLSTTIDNTSRKDRLFCFGENDFFLLGTCPLLACICHESELTITIRDSRDWNPWPCSRIYIM
jgi:hypothetical protein